MSYNFKQYDSRWAKKPYCSPGTMATDGCGPSAVADLVYNLDKTITPWTVAQWMTRSGYATKHQGTIWAGITNALKHYGFEVMGIEKGGKGDISMTTFLAEMSKGDRWGIILFGAGSRGGVTWTMGGHYMAAVDYRVKDGDEELYMYDSGTRGHNGWYSYKKHMKGLCVLAYISVKKPTAQSGYTGELPNLVTETSTNNAQKIIDMCTKLCYPNGTPEKRWAYKTGTPTEAYVDAYQKHTSRPRKKISYSDCGYFTETAVKASGVDSTFKGLNFAEDYKKSETLEVVHTGALGSFKLRDGDVVEYKKTSGQHTVIIYDISKNLVAEAGREARFDVIHKSTKYNSANVKKSTLRVIRAKDTTVKKTVSLCIGDKRTEEIKKLQRFLNWCLGGSLTIDGKFGAKTDAAVKQFQKAHKLTVDGKVGSKTLAKMKEVS